MCAIFSVLNSEYPAGNLVWYSDVHSKQWAVIEFLVTKKQSVMRIHKWLKKYMVSMLFIKELFCHWDP